MIRPFKTEGYRTLIYKPKGKTVYVAIKLLEARKAREEELYKINMILGWLYAKVQ